MKHRENAITSVLPRSIADSDHTFQLENYLGHLLRKASQRTGEIFHRVMGNYDVTPTQFAALIKLHDEGEVSQNVLGRLTAMDPATILGVVSRLRRRDLVASRFDPNDGRRILLCLTEDGKAVVSEMIALADDVATETLTPLTKTESRTLLRLLAKLT